MGLLKIRRMTEHDVEEVWRIERDLFSIPWSKASFLFEAGNNRSSYAIVGTHEGIIAGYAVGWFIADELHIGNIAVVRYLQGKGGGKQLLENLLDEAFKRSIQHATLEVRVSNVRAINLYRGYGFKGIALRKCYYTDNGEDALVMLAEIKPGGTKEMKYG
jgi:ribosomal-protein-alanine N-acetyltransferase